MNPSNQLRFSLSDYIDEAEVSPSLVPLALLAEFQKDIGDFLRGSNREIDSNKILISIEAGSLAFVATGLLSAITLWTDLENLKASDSLNRIDYKRATIIERWQSLAKKNPHRSYLIANSATNLSFLIDATSNFRRIEDAWVHVEKYLHGIVFDMGGNTKANVHLKLENGVILPPITSTQDYLEKNGQDRLYRPALLHVTAEENLHTGELRNLNLLAFETHQPSYDDDEFKLMVERGTQTWANIPSSTEWLEAMRGGQS